MRDYVQRNFVDQGMCADWAIHDSENDKGQRNLHIHVLFTMRPITENAVANALERKGIQTERGIINREITKNNMLLEQAKEMLMLAKEEAGVMA